MDDGYCEYFDFWTTGLHHLNHLDSITLMKKKAKYYLNIEQLLKHLSNCSIFHNYY